MKQRIASAAIALALAFGSVVLAEAPASAAPSCQVRLTVVHVGSRMAAKVDSAGCYAVQANIRGYYSDGVGFSYYGAVSSSSSTTSPTPTGATSIQLWSHVKVTPTSPGRTLQWSFSQSGTWRTVY